MNEINAELALDRIDQKFERLRVRLAAAEAERDAARAGKARAVEALDVFARAYRVSMLPFAPGIDEADGAHHWMPHGWPSVADFKLANSVLSDSPALAWLAQQRREAAAEALDEAAEHCETTELLMPVPKPGTTLREHGANVCVAMAGELRQRAAALRAGATGGADA